MRWRRTGSGNLREPGSTGSSPRPLPAPTSPTSGSCSRSSTNAPPTVWWLATGRTRPARMPSAPCCSASSPTPGAWAAPGGVGAPRKELCPEWRPLVTTFEGHPWNWGQAEGAAERAGGARNPRDGETSRWNAGKDLSFIPLRPERVVEVRYDHMEGRRLRHPAQFARWRPDRDPRSCTYAQLEEPVSYDLGAVLATK